MTPGYTGERLLFGGCIRIRSDRPGCVGIAWLATNNIPLLGAGCVDETGSTTHVIMASISVSSGMERAFSSSRRGAGPARRTCLTARPRQVRRMPQFNVKCSAEAASSLHPKVVCIGEALFGAPCSLEALQVCRSNDIVPR